MTFSRSLIMGRCRPPSPAAKFRGAEILDNISRHLSTIASEQPMAEKQRYKITNIIDMLITDNYCFGKE
jgi:hypothetical protein